MIEKGHRPAHMDGSVATYPELLPLAARIARAHGCRTIITLGPPRWAGAAPVDPDLDVVEIRPPGGRREDGRLSRFHRRVTWDPGAQVPVDREVLARSVVVCTSLDGGTEEQALATLALRALLQVAPVAVVVAQESRWRTHQGLAGVLREAGLLPTFAGRLSQGGTTDVDAVIVDRVVGEGKEVAPPDFRVVAVMTAYNEEDIIGPSIAALVGGGIDVHLIDNWSTDRTHAIAEQFLGRGLVGLERYPEEPTPTFELARLLHRVEEVAAGLRTDWCVHHDADERKVSPWPGRSLRDALWVVQRSGFNAIDQTVLNFRPVDNGFVAGADFEEYFRSFEFGSELGDQLKIQAWRNTGQRVVLAESGGHEAVFAGRRVFPYKFLLKHYPIRSQAHGHRKILVERRARWNPVERTKGWHVHYDDVTPTHRFVRDPKELLQFVDGRTQLDYLVPFVSGVGLASPTVPGWAGQSLAGRVVYRAAKRAADGPVANSLRSSPLFRLSAVRDALRWLRRRLLGGAS